jgi:hypothetical protein
MRKYLAIIPGRSNTPFSLLVKKTEHHRLDDVPDVLCRVAELAASHTGTKREVADGDGVVLVLVGEVVITLGHGSDEDADALLGTEVCHVVADAHDGGVKGEGDFAAVRGQVVGDGVLDDLEELLLRGGGADGQLVQELDHQTGEALEGTRDAHGRRDLDEDALCGVDVDLQSAGLVDGRVEQGQEALVGDVGARVRDVAVHFAHDSDVLVAVEERVLVIFHAIAATVRGFVGLEAGVGEDDDQALGVLVVGCDGDVLLGDELWEGGWWERLGLSACSSGRRLVSHCKDLVER